MSFLKRLKTSKGIIKESQEQLLPPFLIKLNKTKQNKTKQNNAKGIKTKQRNLNFHRHSDRQHHRFTYLLYASLEEIDFLPHFIYVCGQLLIVLCELLEVVCALCGLLKII